ncbi:hypothetical protein ABH931_003097 [Streptacidiphilus sp. MAP12-33]|uniref:hypothetical protein n=1 Tax=Streptacidiphilus sp. MAP12-33 TaxID=3156266 RepID=UPI00351357B3
MHRLARPVRFALIALPALAFVAACGGGADAGPTPAHSSASARAAAASASAGAAAEHAAQDREQALRKAGEARIDTWLARTMATAGIPREDQLKGSFGTPPDDGCLDGYRYLFAARDDNGLSAAVRAAAAADGWTSAPAGDQGEARFTKSDWELWIVENQYPDSTDPQDHGLGVDIHVQSNDSDCGP